MSAEDGVVLTKALRCETVIPIHYEGWTHFKESKEKSAQIFEKHDLEVTWLDIGVKHQIDV